MGQSQSDQKPEPGDLIEIFRGGYSHWAVYVGDGYVVHVTTPPGVPGKLSNMSVHGQTPNILRSVPTEEAVVRREKLKDVVGDDKWRINNSLDMEYESRPADIIVKEALRQVDKVIGYNMFTKNCEHFVNELRYGKPESWQVRNAEQAAAAATGIVATVAGVVVAAVSIVSGRTRN